MWCLSSKEDRLFCSGLLTAPNVSSFVERTENPVKKTGLILQSFSFVCEKCMYVLNLTIRVL